MPQDDASSVEEDQDLETQELTQQPDEGLAEILEADFIEDADPETKNEEELF